MPETLQFTYKNITIGYSDAGNGPAAIFLHGFLENRKMWDAFLPDLSLKNRVITIDLLGHGDTGCIGYVHTMEENAQMIHSLLSSLKIKKCILAGHSMGGYVALAYAELFPQAIKGIMLINSTAAADSDERKVNRDRAIVAVKQNHANFVRMSVANLFSEDNRARLSDEIEVVKLEALKTPLQGIVASLEGMKLRPDRQEIIRSAKFPVIIVLGRKDEVLNYDENLQMANDGNIETVSFEDGHMSTVENREQLLDVISAFLRKIK